MKILVLGDPHGCIPKNLNGIIKKNQIKIIICVGDVPPVPKEFRKGKINYFPKAFLKRADLFFKEYVKKICSYRIPVLILRGNMYLTGSRNKLTKEIFSRYPNLIYKKTGKIKFEDENFVLFDMSFEPHMYKNSDSWMRNKFDENKRRKKKLISLLKSIKQNAVIVSHAPPYGHLDNSYKGRRGSKILLEAIKQFQPKLVLCGHIHENSGTKKIGKTTIINLGEGKYQVIELIDNKINITLKGCPKR
ncbi:MAG: metallophosphoesterase [Nanoarchaeota archaeon]|nr:metallophosphoesterase [Nanoarchaeota archaeon]MBU4086241.1 metallophosphoesterase [Nanoarchaeota archaeon]